jgi:CHAD domain-containing protein
MDYQFNNNEPCEVQIRNVLVQQTGSAVALLDHYEQDPLASVHQTRQHFKRIRSLLRLVRNTDPYVYAIENRLFRDEGRRLSPIRDDDAIGLLLDTLLAEHSNEHPHELAILESLIAADIERDKRQNAGTYRSIVYAILEELEYALKRYAVLELRPISTAEVLAVLEQTLHEAREAYRVACLEDTADHFHSWRKQMKHATHQLRLCAELPHGHAADYADDFKIVADTLGRHQDLSIMLERLEPIIDNSPAHASVMQLAQQWQLAERELARQQMQVLLEGGHPASDPANRRPGRLTVV